jgi:Tol biopolymer transport system component
MQMKKALALSVLAAALSASAVTPVFAQSAAGQHAVQFAQTTFQIDAAQVSIRTISENGSLLASVRDLANALGASLQFVKSGTVTVQYANHTVVLNPASAAITVDGQAVALSTPVKVTGYTTFVEPQAFIEALGVAYSEEDETPAIRTYSMIAGAERAIWVNESKLLVSSTVEEGRQDYLVDAATGKYELLLTSDGASDLVLSPDSKSAAYADADGLVFILDLATKQSKQISKDTSIKNELQWANDGSALFFLQGDKSSVIAKLNVADGVVSKALEDKVDYKANLEVSADGKKFAYYVFKQPTVTADSSKDVELDDVAIDATGTEAQIYYYDAAKADNKAVQLTKDDSDKVFLELSQDGTRVSYVSVSADEASTGKLMSVDVAKQISTVAFGSKDVYQIVQIGNKTFLLTAENDTSNAIYEIGDNGAVKQIAVVSDSATQLSVSAGSSLALMIDDKLSVWTNGKWVQITE